jgi:hypothetical protein
VPFFFDFALHFLLLEHLSLLQRDDFAVVSDVSAFQQRFVFIDPFAIAKDLAEQSMGLFVIGIEPHHVFEVHSPLRLQVIVATPFGKRPLGFDCVGGVLGPGLVVLKNFSPLRDGSDVLPADDDATTGERAEFHLGAVVIREIDFAPQLAAISKASHVGLGGGRDDLGDNGPESQAEPEGGRMSWAGHGTPPELFPHGRQNRREYSDSTGSAAAKSTFQFWKSTAEAAPHSSDPNGSTDADSWAKLWFCGHSRR